MNNHEETGAAAGTESEEVISDSSSIEETSKPSVGETDSSAQKKDGGTDDHLGGWTVFGFTLVALFWIPVAVLVVWGLYDGWLQKWLSGLGEESQVGIIKTLWSSLLIFSGAVLAPFVFKDRIKGLNSMIDVTKKEVKNASGNISALQIDLKTKLEKLSDEAEQRDNNLNKHITELQLSIAKIYSQGEWENSEQANDRVNEYWRVVVDHCEDRLKARGFKKPKTSRILSYRSNGARFYDELLKEEIINQFEYKCFLRLMKYYNQTTEIDKSKFPDIRDIIKEVEKINRAWEKRNA